MPSLPIEKDIAMTPPTAPEGYRYYTPMTIRYGDMDTLGHVNNAKYLTYLEQARVSYFRDNGLWDGALSALGLIIARVTIDYKLPLTTADGTIDIWTRCNRLGNKSFDIEHQIITRRTGDAVIAATGTTVIVVFDYQKQMAIALPDAWRALLLAYEPALREA
ncbi:MAG: acyl-CoA thioesterase [Armatimonadetes bacterium]|nr:acyl-CoA thioesterase [Anaerolineae bacterium]